MDLGPAGEKAHCDCCQHGLGRAVALQLTAEGVEVRDLRSERRNFLGVRQGELVDGTRISVDRRD
jgi:hypothetical protein